ncbi:MAG: ATP synthase F1 subunit epsilon [Candidatus Saccharimonadales bacterium]
MLHFQLITLTGTKFEQDVSEVILPTRDGQIGVLAHHMPLISVASAGTIAVRINPKDSDTSREYFATYGGAIEVSDNKLRVLVDEADHADEINEAEAQRAFDAAQKAKLDAKDQISLADAQSLIDRSSVRLEVASLKRNKKPHKSI